jgi:ribosomal protein S18 acetylase RimI-like enzyme
MEIRRYTPADDLQLFDLMREEGDDWSAYYETKNTQYRAALVGSIVYVAVEDSRICGYIRARDDAGFGVYIYDLLVAKTYRGQSLGMRLMAHVHAEHPENTVYVMSDVDGYYLKQGFRRIGSVFEVC